MTVLASWTKLALHCHFSNAAGRVHTAVNCPGSLSMPPQPASQHSLWLHVLKALPSVRAQARSVAVLRSPALVSSSQGITAKGHSILSVAPVCFISSAKHEFIPWEQDVLAGSQRSTSSTSLYAEHKIITCKSDPTGSMGFKVKQTHPAKITSLGWPSLHLRVPSCKSGTDSVKIKLQ